MAISHYLTTERGEEREICAFPSSAPFTQPNTEQLMYLMNRRQTQQGMFVQRDESAQYDIK